MRNVSCDLAGGGGKLESAPPKTVLEASESGTGLVCAHFLWGKWQGMDKRGGGKRKAVFGEGFYGMFAPPLSFPPSFAALWK